MRAPALLGIACSVGLLGVGTAGTPMTFEDGVQTLMQAAPGYFASVRDKSTAIRRQGETDYSLTIKIAGTQSCYLQTYDSASETPNVECIIYQGSDDIEARNDFHDYAQRLCSIGRTISHSSCGPSWASDLINGVTQAAAPTLNAPMGGDVTLDDFDSSAIASVDLKADLRGPRRTVKLSVLSPIQT